MFPALSKQHPPSHKKVNGASAATTRTGAHRSPRAAGRSPAANLSLEKGKAVAAVDEDEEEVWDGTKPPTSLELYNLLERLNSAGANLFLPAFIHKADVYSASPADLVKDRQHAPGQGHGTQASCYFHCMPAPGKPRRRKRRVGVGGQEDAFWHQEGKVEPIIVVGDDDVGHLPARKTMFSYMVKTTAPPAMAMHLGSSANKAQRTGWTMMEISPGTGRQQDHLGMVLCALYKSKHKYKSMEEEAALVLAGGARVGGIFNPTLSIDTGAFTELLLQRAAETALSGEFKKVSEIPEFSFVKERYLRTISYLGLDLDKKIVSVLLGKLKQILKEVAANKELTSDVRQDIVSCGEKISTTISMAYLNKFEKNLQQACNALGIIGFKVHHEGSQRARKVMNVSLVVQDSEAKERRQVIYASPVEESPIPEKSPGVAGSSGDKRKAASGDHPEAPPLQRTDNYRSPSMEGLMQDTEGGFSDIAGSLPIGTFGGEAEDQTGLAAGDHVPVQEETNFGFTGNELFDPMLMAPESNSIGGDMTMWQSDDASWELFL